MIKLNLSRREKKIFFRIVTALILFACVFTVDKIVGLGNVFDNKFGWLFPFFLYLVIYLIIGYDVLFKAIRNIFHGQVLDENFLMMIATVGAFSLAIYRGVRGEEIEGFDEACAVLIFYQVGEFFQRYASGKARKSISSLMDIRPDYANALRGEEIVVVSPEEVVVGDIIVVNPGEKIPLDGVIVKGRTSLDTKALTGESLPSEVEVGSSVISGSINISSEIQVKVTKPFYDSTVSKILELVENATSQKSKAENFITKFAKYYTPIVVSIALILAIVPGIITKDWSVWIYRALSFLVVSCPCALVISIPLSFFAGIGASSKYGILIKGSNYLELLDKANIFVFDKTGTLTKGNFVVTKVTPSEKREEILMLSAIAEQHSSHPIAKSIIDCYNKPIKGDFVLTDVAGKGIVATNSSDTILCGNEKLMQDNNIAFVKEEGFGTVVYVAKNGTFVGSILISDEIKPETKSVINKLNSQNCKTVMLTGDNQVIAKSVADEIGLSSFKASLLPQNKVEEVEKLIKEKNKNDVLCFVGDGINDAPTLMRADIGIAMGGVGSDSAIEASDVVLMKDDLSGIPLAKKIAKKTMNIVRQNITFSIAVKVLILCLSAIGITNMWVAVFGDVGVAIIAILNAMRANSKYE